jgi:hypothetical protein
MMLRLRWSECSARGPPTNLDGGFAVAKKKKAAKKAPAAKKAAKKKPAKKKAKKMAKCVC